VTYDRLVELLPKLEQLDVSDQKAVLAFVEPLVDKGAGLRRCDGACGYSGGGPDHQAAHDRFLDFEDRGFEGVAELIVYAEVSATSDADGFPPVVDWRDYVTTHSWREPGRVWTIIRAITEPYMLRGRWRRENEELRHALRAVVASAEAALGEET
jgi:hypothetical protein